jgi:ribosomal-protein-alanine N-acetyltransferase
MEYPALTTTRLVLRAFGAGDIDDIVRLAGDFAIADTTLMIPYPYSRADAEQWLATHLPKFEAGEQVTLAVTDRQTGELVGAVGLAVAARFDRAELGYWIGKPYWRKGYCTEAAGALMEWGFLNLNLNRIYASHFKRNPASGRVMQKLGMTREGEFREHIKKWDRYENMVYYGILRGEWAGKAT